MIYFKFWKRDNELWKFTYEEDDDSNDEEEDDSNNDNEEDGNSNNEKNINWIYEEVRKIFNQIL